MDPIRIEDPADPRVVAFLDIRERDLTGRQGRFVAEGKVVLDILLSGSRFAPESVLVLENRLAGLEEILGKASPGLPVYVVSSAVMDRIAGFPMHRGILAIGRKGEPAAAETLLAALPALSRAEAPGLTGPALVEIAGLQPQQHLSTEIKEGWQFLVLHSEARAQNRKPDQSPASVTQ